MPAPVTKYIASLREDRRTLYNFRNSVGRRKDNIEVNRALYNNIDNVIQAINKLLTEHTEQTTGKKLRTPYTRNASTTERALAS